MKPSETEWGKAIITKYWKDHYPPSNTKRIIDEVAEHIRKEVEKIGMQQVDCLDCSIANCQKADHARQYGYVIDRKELNRIFGENRE